jgi:hypothetical protein
MKLNSSPSARSLFVRSVVKGMAVAAVISTLLIVLFSGRGDRSARGAPEEEETTVKKEEEPRSGKRRRVEFWLGDQRIDTREELDAARGARREQTKEFYVAAHDGSEEYRRLQIDQARSQYDRDRVDNNLEKATITDEEINRMEREALLIW